MTVIVTNNYADFRGLTRGLAGPWGGLTATRPTAAAIAREGSRGRKTNCGAPTRCPTQTAVFCRRPAFKKVTDACRAASGLFSALAPIGPTTAISRAVIAAFYDEIRSTGSTSSPREVATVLVPNVAITILGEISRALIRAEAGAVCEKMEGLPRLLADSGNDCIFCATGRAIAVAIVLPSGLGPAKRCPLTSRRGRRLEKGLRGSL